MRIQRRTRAAFTLVEMMVATALTLFIMAIIAEAFGSATKTFGVMRTAGQLQERERTAAQVIRRDLASEHFDGPFMTGRSGPRVGDQRLDQPGWMPPRGGYFELRKTNVSVIEPFNGPVLDGEGLPSTRNDGDILRFTVKLGDLPAAELFCAQFQALPAQPTEPYASDPRINAFPVPGGSVIYSRWAEIEYWLQSNGEVTQATGNGPQLPLYSLRRRVRVLAPAGVNYVVADKTRALVLMASYPDLALLDVGALPNNGGEVVRVLGPEDVTNPAARIPYASPAMKVGPTGPYETGDDILATDVVSFEVKAAWFQNASFNNLNTPPPAPQVVGLYGSSPPSLPPLNPANPSQGLNPDAPFDDIPITTLNIPLANAQARVFDTWYRAPTFDGMDWDRPMPASGGPGFLTRRIDQVPLRINVRAVQIRLRIWDSKSKQARQMTIVQEI